MLCRSYRFLDGGLGILFGEWLIAADAQPAGPAVGVARLAEDDGAVAADGEFQQDGAGVGIATAPDIGGYGLQIVATQDCLHDHTGFQARPATAVPATVDSPAFYRRSAQRRCRNRWLRTLSARWVQQYYN